jgi:hypothetical protein
MKEEKRMDFIDDSEPIDDGEEDYEEEELDEDDDILEEEEEEEKETDKEYEEQFTEENETIDLTKYTMAQQTPTEIIFRYNTNPTSPPVVSDKQPTFQAEELQKEESPKMEEVQQPVVEQSDKIVTDTPKQE